MLRFCLYGLVFRVWGFGFKVWDLGFMVKRFSGAIGSRMPSCQHAPQPKYEIFPGRDPVLATYLTLGVLGAPKL